MQRCRLTWLVDSPTGQPHWLGSVTQFGLDILRHSLKALNDALEFKLVIGPLRACAPERDGRVQVTQLSLQKRAARMKQDGCRSRRKGHWLCGHQRGQAERRMQDIAWALREAQVDALDGQVEVEQVTRRKVERTIVVLNVPVGTSEVFLEQERSLSMDHEVRETDQGREPASNRADRGRTLLIRESRQVATFCLLVKDALRSSTCN